MPGVRIELDGVEPLLSSLDARAARLDRDTAPLFAVLGEEWASSFRGFILQQGSPGQPFVALSATTQRLREKEGFAPAAPILVRKSDLVNSLRVLETSAFELAVGTDFPRARLLHFGGTTSSASRLPNRPVPARPFVLLTPEMIDDALEMVAAHFTGDDGAAT